MIADHALLARVASLGGEDRAWLLRRLPRQKKLALVERLAGSGARLPAESKVIAATPTFDTVLEDRHLETIPIAQLARTLSNEPSWLVAALLNGRSSTWQQALLAALPENLRSDVMRLDAARFAPSEALRGLVLGKLLQVVGSAEPFVPGVGLARRGWIARLRAAFAYRVLRHPEGRP
jgi:hypothetical protein